MNKLKIVSVALFASLALNSLLLIKAYSIEIDKLLSNWYETDLIYKESCPDTVEKNRICSVKVLEKRSDFAMVRVHYHYKKSEEATNKVVVKANKGSHDNIIGTRGGFDLVEGDNTIDIPFGMYKGGVYTGEEPYVSKFIMVKAQGITEDGKRYTSPPIFEIYAKYEHPWYTVGENTSWQ